MRKSLQGQRNAENSPWDVAKRYFGDEYVSIEDGIEQGKKMRLEKQDHVPDCSEF